MERREEAWKVEEGAMASDSLQKEGSPADALALV